MRARIILSILIFWIVATGATPEAVASANDDQKYLVAAIRDGETERIRKMLSRGVSLDFTYEGFPPLHFAANSGFPEVVRLLIREGAEIDARDKFGNVALHYAVLKGHSEVVRVLADHYADLNVRDNGGNTALQTAAKRGDITVRNILLRAGAKTTEDFGKTTKNKGIAKAEAKTTEDFGKTTKNKGIAKAEAKTTEGFWEGAENKTTFKEGFGYGFEQGMRGNMPSYFYLLWFAVIAVFAFACWQGAKKRRRNPWIWAGLTAVTLLVPLLPLLCWVPYVILRLLGGPVRQQGGEIDTK